MKEGLVKLSFSVLKWFCISLATVYLGFKWVQNEFKSSKYPLDKFWWE